MTDMQLIAFCAKQCKTAKALFAWDRVNRMIDLAGNPKAYERVIGGSFHVMRGEMQVLVDLARKRMARPAGGLPIRVGRAYRDVNGEVRQVVDMPPRHRSFDVVWKGARGTEGCMRMNAFQEWALEEIQSENSGS